MERQRNMQQMRKHGLRKKKKKKQEKANPKEIVTQLKKSSE